MLLTSDHIIFLVQFGINQHSKILWKIYLRWFLPKCTRNHANTYTYIDTSILIKMLHKWWNNVETNDKKMTSIIIYNQQLKKNCYCSFLVIDWLFYLLCPWKYFTMVSNLTPFASAFRCLLRTCISWFKCFKFSINCNCRYKNWHQLLLL